MSDWVFLNKHRVRQQVGPLPGTDDSFGFYGLFVFALPGEARRIRCIGSGGFIGMDAADMDAQWEHVSVSFIGSNKTPPWELMCKIKDLFWDPEAVVIQIHPAHSQYVNNHPGCLHLWRSLTHPQPLPPSHMVGRMGMTQKDVESLLKLTGAI